VNVDSIKKMFPVLAGNSRLAYLDSVASSQTPYRVIEEMEDYYHNYRANIHRGIYPLSEEATNKYEEARRIVAGFIGAEEKEVIFTSGSTESMNMLVYALEQENWEEGSEIVTTVMEHHSTLIPLQELAKRNNLLLKHAPVKADYTLDYEKAAELITDNTKLVASTWVSNVLGTTNDVRKLAELAHAKNARIAIDGAQAVGHMPVDVKEIDCDFLFFSGHKMCGPTGIGVLYGKKDHLKEIHPSIFGGGAVEEVTLTDTTFTGAPQKFESGTRNIAGAIGLGEAVRFLEGVGVGAITEHVAELTQYAYEQLNQIEGVSIVAADPDKNAGIISFTVDGIHPHDVAEIAARHKVAIRAGHHCAQPLHTELGVPSTARASFYVYNTKEDIDKLIFALLEAQKTFA